MSSEYIKKIRTEDGDKQIDYESLIIAETAFTVNGGHEDNEKSKN